MALKRKYAAPKDPRKQYPKLRKDLTKRVFATQDNCGICGHEVDKTLPAFTPMSPEIDEIIPVALGGSPYDFDNLQLAHRVCNQKKGKKLMDEGGIDSTINPIPTSKAW